MSAGMGATVITKVVAVVGAAPVGIGVGVDTGVGGASTVAVGAGGVLAGAWPSNGPMSSPHFAPALGRAVKCPSPATIIAAAISAGPPSWSKRHCIPSRSSGPIPVFDAASSHSSSFRHAIVTESAAMLPAMALPGSPSIPAVMTALGSMTSNAARTQSDVSWLSGSGPGTNPARKILATVSSSRHPKNLVCSSLGAELGPVSDRTSFPASSPIHASSLADSSESNAEMSSAWRGAGTPRDTGFAVGSGVGGLDGVALGAAVGLSACDSVGTGVAVAVGAAVGAGV